MAAPCSGKEGEGGRNQTHFACKQKGGDRATLQGGLFKCKVSEHLERGGVAKPRKGIYKQRPRRKTLSVPLRVEEVVHVQSRNVFNLVAVASEGCEEGGGARKEGQLRREKKEGR